MSNIERDSFANSAFFEIALRIQLSELAKYVFAPLKWRFDTVIQLYGLIRALCPLRLIVLFATSLRFVSNEKVCSLSVTLKILHVRWMFDTRHHRQWSERQTTAIPWHPVVHKTNKIYMRHRCFFYTCTDNKS